jgi:hypothetical protein
LTTVDIYGIVLPGVFLGHKSILSGCGPKRVLKSNNMSAKISMTSRRHDLESRPVKFTPRSLVSRAMMQSDPSVRGPVSFRNPMVAIIGFVLFTLGILSMLVKLANDSRLAGQ